MKIALLTGGPSFERGISLNSARSVLDHLGDENTEIIPIYFDTKKRAYKISISQLYSNTPSDFDFKLSQNSKPLNKNSLIKVLKSVDIVFPAMHGAFGEDGQIQSFLEKNKIPFIGSPSKACKIASDKFSSNNLIRKNNFYTLPSALLKIYSNDNEKIIKDFFKMNNLKEAIVKPAGGGSSIGVFSVKSEKEALEKAKLIFSKRIDTKVVIEPFAKGKEFTVIVLQNTLGLPVAILPTEIEMTYHEGRIFDFRKKYLPTNQVKYHCPARFKDEVIEKIRIQAVQLFSLFGMKDFARFDGWLLNNGEIWFSDLNPISGMEQNSFLFQQSSRIGMSHSNTLQYIVKNSCNRQNIKINKIQNKNFDIKNKKEVAVLFGGSTSERQVSLMSGTNVWLKLRKSKIYNPKPYLLDFENNVWELPYTLILNHTVEEIIENAKSSLSKKDRLERLVNIVKDELVLKKEEYSEPFFIPRKITFKEFLKKSKFVFLALHGGDGENGNLQKLLTLNKLKFNGSGEKTSHLCMDKFATGEFIRSLKIKGLDIASQKVLIINDIKQTKDVKSLWNSLLFELNAKTLIVKPKDDGCSSGVAHLYNEKDLKNYIDFVFLNKSFIPSGTLTNQTGNIEMPTSKQKELLFENFIETDKILIKSNKLKYKRVNGFVEITVGVIEKNNKIYALNPSITIAEGEVLSLEEKFQGGTGINITPPPKEIINKKSLNNARDLIAKLALKIGIKGYARIDAFMNIKNGNLNIIEINTLPGLTPSTVFYHQGLSENPQIFPCELLEKIIKSTSY